MKDRYEGFDEVVMRKHFKEFIADLSHRLSDEPDYDRGEADDLLPKLQELMNMVDCVVPESWENRLGEAFMKENDNE
tara:strand:+ start:480 stop:710 length:231 start_codon:yes stop_codon:yes gene_type:complete